MTVLEMGDEITDQEMKRMSLLHAELEAFEQELKLRIAGGKEAPL